MKWRFAVIMLLFLCAAAVIPIAHARLDAPRNEVEVYETVVEGDPAAAAGLVLELRLDMGAQLFWEVSHPLRGETQTESYFRERPVWPNHGWDGVETWHMIDLGETVRDEWGYYTGGYLVGKLDLVEKDIASRTESGERHTETVLLGDYYETYPLDIGYGYYSSPFASDEAQRQAARDFFRIPVMQDQSVSMTFERTPDGSAKLMEFESESGPFQLSHLELEMPGDLTYMTLCQKGSGALDYSQIPGGLGIYRAPLIDSDVYAYSSTPRPDFTRLETVFSLPEAEAVEWFSDSFDRSKLYLVTREAAGRMFTVIDLATMEQLQKFSLDEKGPLAEIHDYVVHEDGVLFYVDEEEILYLAADEAGLLSLVLRGDFHTAPPEGVSYGPAYVPKMEDGTVVLEEVARTPPTSNVLFNHPTAAWDGERLALLCKDANYDSEFDGAYCRVHLMVFADDRRQYYGYFDNSLDKQQAWGYPVQVESMDEDRPYGRDYVSAYRVRWAE